MRIITDVNIVSRTEGVEVCTYITGDETRHIVNGRGQVEVIVSSIDVEILEQVLAKNREMSLVTTTGF